VSAPEPPADERDDDGHRTFVNLVAAIVILVLAIAAFWVMRALDDQRKLQTCLDTGRRDCLERVEPAAGAPK